MVGSRTPGQGSPKGSAKEQCSRRLHRCPLMVHSSTHDTGRITRAERSVKPSPGPAFPRGTADPDRLRRLARTAVAGADLAGRGTACPGPWGTVTGRTFEGFPRTRRVNPSAEAGQASREGRLPCPGDSSHARSGLDFLPDGDQLRTDPGGEPLRTRRSGRPSRRWNGRSAQSAGFCGPCGTT